MDYTRELEKMQHLMNFGVNESKTTVNPNGIVEYSQKGADGKTYGVVREGTKYYVKVAPKKDTQILAEDYDYVGGYLSRKAYPSYTAASNALNLELIHVNESNGSKEPVKSQFSINESAEWQNAETKEAQAELSRFYQLCENVDKLLDGNVHYIKEDKNAPYTEKGPKDANKGGGGTEGPKGQQQPLGIKEKDYTDGDKKVNPETIYNKNGVNGTSPSGKYNAANGVEKISNEEGNPYQDKANASKEQGKTVANESKKHVIKLTEEQKKQVLAWRDDRAFVHQSSDSELDRSHGTEIGDTAPFDDKVNENFETSEWDDGLPSNAGVGDPKQYKEPFENQNGVTQPVSENVVEFEVGGDFDDDDIQGSANDVVNSDLGADDSSIYNHLSNYGEGNDSLGVNLDDPLADIPDFDSDEPAPDVDMTAGDDNIENPMGDGIENPMDDNIDNTTDNGMSQQLYETIKRIVEDKLDDFGKHPAYQKKVMSLPPNADGSKWGEDWNDESAKGEEPYGKKIGHSGDPFEVAVNAIANAVVTALSKKKE